MHDLLTSLGWDVDRDAELEPFSSSGGVPARVSRIDRGCIDVITPDNPLRLEVRPGDPPVAVGDWVVLTAADRQWRLEAVLDRRSAIRRGSVTGESVDQVLATNVDLAIVAVAAVPEPRRGMVERLVALAWDSGATPVVALTKSDLAPDPDAAAEETRALAPGVDVLTVTAATHDGFAPLRELMVDGRTCCLLGRSGAGKSTITNALLGESRFATTAIRADGKGRHTTTFRELVLLPDGGVVIDTPGLRSVGLWLEGEGLERAFSDVEDLVAGCRFSDCGHVGEPGCEVLAAVDDGRLDERRLAAWRKLQREAAWVARRSDARLRAQEARKWKAISVEMRRSGRARP